MRPMYTHLMPSSAARTRMAVDAVLAVEGVASALTLIPIRWRSEGRCRLRTWTR